MLKSISRKLCYNAQQAAEKAIKAVLVKSGKEFPYSHNLARLLDLLADSAIKVPDYVRRTEDLTRFAFEARYPSVAREVTAAQYAEALEIAEAAVGWAERIILDD